MNARLTHQPAVLPDRRQPIAWLGFVVLLLSLLAPQLSIESAEAAQIRTTQQTECDEGFVLDERTGECEREPQRVPGQITTECAEGTVREPETGACIPVTETPAPETETPVVTETATEAPVTETATTEVVEPPAPVGYAQAIKRACPEGFVPDETTTITDLQNTCVDPIEGVLFHILVGDATPVSVPTDADGLSQLGSAPVGEIAVVEEIPDGYGEPIVYCAEGYAFGPFEHTYTEGDRQPLLNGNGIAWTLAADTLLQCFYYNIAADDGTPGDLTTQGQAEAGEEVEHRITLTKRTCPAGTDPDAGLGSLLGACVVTPGVEFTLEYGEGASSTTETSAAGVVSWDGIPYGEFEILETNSMDYVLQSAHCQFEDLPGPGAWIYDFTDGVYDGSFDVGLDPEDDSIHLVCDWFNFEGGEGAGVTVVKHRCPLGVPEDLTIDQYIAICTDHFEGIDFTLEHPGGTFPGTTGENGQATWPNVPSGDIDIQEDIPEGYKDPLVFCNWFDGEQVLQSGQVAATGGGIELDVPADATTVVCHVFNFQDENAHSLTMHKWECPAGFDENVDDPETHCTTPLDGVTFTLSEMEAVSGDAGPGTALFSGIPNGEYGLTEILPEGFERAFYGGCLVNGQGVLVAVGGGNVPSLELGFGEDETEHWECTWYNVPEEPEENNITVRKWVCPIGASHDEDQGWYEANCLAQHDGVTFNVSSGAYLESGVTVGGTVVFDGIPAGLVTIEEPFLAGFGEPVVFCAVDDQWTQYDASNPPGDWQHDFPSDGESEELFCYVFNIPTGDRTVVAIKYTCPSGPEPESEDFLDWFNTCDDIVEDIEFTLADSNGETTSSPDWIGQTRFEDVSPGDLSLTEHTPPGFQPPIVFCTLVTWLDNGTPIVIQTEKQDVAGNTVSRTIDEPAFLLVCAFFNIPVDPEVNAVEIHKWQCPEGTEPDQPVDWYEANCVQQHDGVEFTVASDIGIAVQETAAGTASFPGLPAGTVSIQETIPDGFGPPMVFCGIEGNPQHYPAPTGHWQHDFPNDGSSETLVCWVFNIPGEPPSITVTKWTCPPGYDVEMAGTDPKADCTEATNGVTFELRYTGHDEIEESQVTGDVIDGGVVFDELQPDSYQITELVPPGIASVFVLECTGHIMGALQPSPLSNDNTLDDIDLEAGEHLTCDWYNVPDDGGKLTVIKYICVSETFVSEVDCEIYEDGATFDLLWWDGADWQVVDAEITDGFGLIVWTGLDSGDYWLDEHDGEWCRIAAYPPGDEDSFAVDAGEETMVEVYNCDPDWDTTTIPEKYPNTGVPPDGRDAQPNLLPAVAQLAATILLLGAWRGGSLALTRSPATWWRDQSGS